MDLSQTHFGPSRSSPVGFSHLTWWDFPLSLLLLSSTLVTTVTGSDFTIIDATVDDIQIAFNHDKLMSRQLVDFYLNRIETLNPLLRSVLEVNPDGRDQADEADGQREKARCHGRSVGELHGVPVLLKGSEATKDRLNTTACSYALLGLVMPTDASVVQRLRNAGAVILENASLTEW